MTTTPAKPMPAPPPPMRVPSVAPEPGTPDGSAVSRFPWGRLALAFAVAGLSDFFCLFLETLPPLQWLLDLVTAAALFLILGRNWLLLPGLVAEAVPVVAIFPTWVLVVAAIALWGKIRR